MEMLKKWEKKLLLEWHTLQLEKIPHLKAEAIKAYYVSFRLYQKQKAHSLRLDSAI